MTITLTHEEAQNVLNLLILWLDEQEEPDTETAIETLRAKLSEPEPKPVAWRKLWEGETEYTYYWMNRYQGSEPLYTAPPQRKECLRCGEVNPAEIHTCTPQREWQGLTVDEFYDLDDVGRKMILEYGRLVEAKLKEKNVND